MVIGLRLERSSLWLLVLGALGCACEVVGDIEERSLLPSAIRECTTNRECTDRASEAGPTDVPAMPADGGYTGRLEDGTVPAVCRQLDGKCVRLLTPDCPSLIGDPLNDNSVLLGTYLTVSGNLANSNVPRQRSALLAAEEINSNVGGGGLPPRAGDDQNRPLVVLNCDPSQDPIRTAKHLIDVGVPAVVGPNVAEDIISVSQQLRGKLLMMSPTAPPDPISNLRDDNLAWRVVPSDSQRAKLLLDQIQEVEAHVSKLVGGRPLKLAIPFRNDALGLSARDSISGLLRFNGHFLSDTYNSNFVRLDPFDLTDTAQQAKIANEYATDFVPDIILVLANEVVANVIVPFEKQRRMLDLQATTGPYYIATDVAKVPTWLNASKNQELLPDFRKRVRGIGLTPDGNSMPAFASFNTAYSSRYGENPGTSAMGPSYDAMYSIAFALAATTDEPVSPNSVANGLLSLAKGTPLQVGLLQAGEGLMRLGRGETIRLRGTHSFLEWDFNGDIVGGTMEVWCIGASGGNPVFASAGKRLDVATQIVEGTYKQCE